MTSIRRQVAVVTLCAGVLVVVLSALRPQRGRSPLKHTVFLSEERADIVEACVVNGTCALAYAECQQDAECFQAVNSSLRRSLVERRSVPWLPRNGKMRALTACAVNNCFPRECVETSNRQVLHHDCDRKKCYIRSDLVTTASGQECAQRCENHRPPMFPESCGAYTWIRSPRLDDTNVKHTCFLIADKKVAKVASRKSRAFRRPGSVSSGKCRGGPKTFAPGQDLCTATTESVAALRAYVRVAKHKMLTDRNADDLFEYLKIAGVCVTDPDFDAILKVFVEKTKKQTNKGSIYQRILSAIVDVFESLSHLASKLNPTIIISIAIPLIAKFRSSFPKVADLIKPFLDYIEKKHLPPTAAAAAAATDAAKKNIDDDTKKKHNKAN